MPFRILEPIRCSRCSGAWDDEGKLPTLKTINGRLKSSGWYPDPDSPGYWICPDCAEELLQDYREPL